MTKQNLVKKSTIINSTKHVEKKIQKRKGLGIKTFYMNLKMFEGWLIHAQINSIPLVAKTILSIICQTTQNSIQPF